MKESVINMKRVLNENLAWLSDDYEVGGPSEPTVTAIGRPMEAGMTRFE
jgi:hypothetical protein